MPPVPRILVVDDDPKLRARVCQAVADELPDSDIGEAATASEAIERVQTEEWTLVIMDIQMPGASGLDALAVIKVARPRLPVSIMSMLPEDPYAAIALGLGAIAFVPKEQLPQRLRGIIELALSLGA